MSGNKIQNPYHLPPETILAGKYRIDQVEQEGGFSIVYRGHDIILDINISIKEYFPRELAYREKNAKNIIAYTGEAEAVYEHGMEKFLTEAQTLAKLQSLSHIVRISDFFYENDTAYIIMDYVQGTNLQNYVQKYGILPPGQVLALMKPILKSLAQIHDRGLLHRDISPQNIIYTEQGEAYLIDFGTTRPFKKDTYMTTTVSFKRGYAAEEQYREKGEQGPWTDVYAICATMYFLLTGNTPTESVQRGIKDTLPSLNEQQISSLTPNIRKALAKGMAVSHEKRYQSIEALYQELYLEENDSLPLFADSGNHVLPGTKKFLLPIICSCLLFGGGLFCGFVLADRQKDKNSPTAVAENTATFSALSQAPVSPTLPQESMLQAETAAPRESVLQAETAAPRESMLQAGTPAPSPAETAAPVEKVPKKPKKTVQPKKKPVKKTSKPAPPAKKPETDKKSSGRKNSPDFDATLPY